MAIASSSPPRKARFYGKKYSIEHTELLPTGEHIRFVLQAQLKTSKSPGEKADAAIMEALREWLGFIK